jgi:tetratricopeptide (TPR) repeat protein
MLVDLLRATSRGDEAREQLEKMAVDLEAAGDKNGARKTRERLQGLDTEPAGPPQSHAPASPPKRGDLIFLDTGIDVPTSPSRGPVYPKTAKEAPRPAPTPPPSPPEQRATPTAPSDPTVPEGLLLNQDLGSPSGASSGQVEDLIIDPLMGSGAVDAGAESLLGIQRLEDTVEPLPDMTAPLDIQRGGESSSLDFQPMTLEGMESSSLSGFTRDQSSSLDFTVQPGGSALDFPDDLIVSLPDTETVFNIDLDEKAGSSDPMDGLPLVTPELRLGETVAELENQVLDDPENPDIHLALAEKLLAAGEVDRVTEELELALAGFEDRQDWTRAAQMADRLVQLSPDSIAHHQKRVELAYRTGERVPLLEAYMGLGDALAKSGALDKAAAVYNRVIEHDPGNQRAAAALAKVGAGPARSSAPPSTKRVEPPSSKAAGKAEPPKAPPSNRASKSTAEPVRSNESRPKPGRAAAAAEEGFVDLGSMLREDSGGRDTRMRIKRADPKDQDEQREFHEILEQFKRGIDENLESDDYQAHYDLGVAFKEMGLLDEAIAEFQKALRASEGRLRTSEALGMAFFEKGQYAVCESVLRRAVDGLEGSDEAKIGLLYWLGRASEALGKKADAMASYERAVAVDIRFMDLSQRIHRLTAGRK